MEQTQEGISQIIIGVINSIFSKMFNAVDNTVYAMLDRIVFVDKSVIEEKSFVKMYGEGGQSGILLICNSLLLGFFVYYAFSYLLSHLTFKQIQRPSQFFFKAVMFIALMNSSLWLCGEMINIVSLITKAINMVCEELFDVEIGFTYFTDFLNNALERNDLTFDLFSFNGIIKAFTTVGMVNLILTYSLRYVMIQLFVLICPFAILSMLNDGTEKLFKSWLKNFLSVLFVQIVLALILLLAFSFKYIFDVNLQKLLYVAIIFAITRMNHFMKELLGGITFDIKQSIGTYM